MTPQPQPQPQPRILAKAQPQTGDVLFFRGDDERLFDRIIMRRTHSYFVHVAVCLSPRLIIQAETGGVRIRPMPSWYSHILHVGARMGKGPNKAQWTRALEDLMLLAGDSYGWLDVLSQLLLLLPGHPAVSLNKSFDCSHLVVVWLQAIGYPLPFDTEASRVTPADLFSALSPVQKGS